MSLEALFGDGVVGLELDPHVVVLGRDDFRDLGAAVLAVQLGVGGEAAAHLHVVVFAHLDAGGGRLFEHVHCGGGGATASGTFRQPTSLPSSSKASNCMEMRYCVGATTCHTQFLLGGYSLGQPGVLMVPFSLERRPPQAAAEGKRREEEEASVAAAASRRSTVPTSGIPEWLRAARRLSDGAEGGMWTPGRQTARRHNRK